MALTLRKLFVRYSGYAVAAGNARLRHRWTAGARVVALKAFKRVGQVRAFERATLADEEP